MFPTENWKENILIQFEQQLNTGISGTMISCIQGWEWKKEAVDSDPLFDPFKISYWIGGEVLNRIFFLFPSFNNVGNGKEEKINTLARAPEKISVKKTRGSQNDRASGRNVSVW